MLLGLKASSDWGQIKDRLQYHPDVFEFFTDVPDFTSQGIQHLRQAIEYVQDQGVTNIVLHQPMNFKGYHSELIVPEQQFPELHEFVMTTAHQLINLAIATDSQCLIHGSYDGEHGFKAMLSAYGSLQNAQAACYHRLDQLKKLGSDHVMFENSISPVFAYGDPQVENEIIRHQFSLVADVSHIFISLHGDNERLVASLRHLKNNIYHYHLVDSLGQTHDSLPIGTGKIDWPSVIPLLNPSATTIYEINLKNQLDCQEQLASHQYLSTLGY